MITWQRIRLTAAACFLLVLGGNFILAQTSVPTADDLRCDREDLLAAQAEIQQQFEDFAQQIEDDTEAALADLYMAGQRYQELATGCGHIPEDIGQRFVGDDVEYIMAALENVPGDPLNGQLLYNNEVPAADGSVLGCVGCHSHPQTAPLTEGTWTRWDEIHRRLPQFEDLTFAQFMVISIIDPWSYTSGDYPEQAMPDIFGSRLSFQDLADLIAYLEGQDQLLP